MARVTIVLEDVKLNGETVVSYQHSIEAVSEEELQGPATASAFYGLVFQGLAGNNAKMADLVKEVCAALDFIEPASLAPIKLAAYELADDGA